MVFSCRRGGRIVKWKGKATSIAPFMTGVALVALAAPAYADCSEGAPGVFYCSGATSDPQNVTGDSPSVSTAADFDLDVVGDDGLTITANSGDVTLFTATGSSIVSDHDGVNITSPGAADITVYGTIEGGNSAISTTGVTGPLTVTVEETGRVVGTTAFSGAFNSPGTTLINRGVIEGGASLGAGDSDVTLEAGSSWGSADGNVYMITFGAGNNTFTVKGGAELGDGFMLQGGDLGQLNTTHTSKLVFDGGTRTLLTASNGSSGLYGWDQLLATGNIDLTLDSAMLQWFQPNTTIFESGYLETPRDGLIIDSGSTVRIKPETYTILGSITNSGALNMADGNIQMLDIGTTGTYAFMGGTGDYTSQGGVIDMDVSLSDGTADILEIYGDTSGTTIINFHNIGGEGVVTDGNGIPVIQVLGDSDGAFILGTPVVSGAYNYKLWEGPGNEFADGKGETSSSTWYLQSEPVSYQPGVPSYEPYPEILQELTRTPTMRQRVGNRYWREPQPPQTVFCKDPAQNFNCTVNDEQAGYYAETVDGVLIENNAVWGRIEGGYGKFSPDVSTSSTTYDSQLWRIQVGVDGLLHENDAGQLIGGLSVHYGSIHANTKSTSGNGDIDVDGYGLDGNLTWLANNGFYTDVVGRIIAFDGDMRSTAQNRSLVEGNDGVGYAASIEAGKRFQLDGDWSVTPQAQLSYIHVSFDDFVDPFGADVSLDDGDSLLGRLGVALDHSHSWQDESGQFSRMDVYGLANLYNEFLDGTSVDVAGTKFDSRNDRLWGGIEIGGAYNWADDKYSVYGQVATNTSLENFGDSYTVSGSLGLRVKW